MTLTIPALFQTSPGLNAKDRGPPINRAETVPSVKRLEEEIGAPIGLEQHTPQYDLILKTRKAVTKGS